MMGREQLSKSDLVVLGLDTLFIEAAHLVLEKQDYRSLVFQKAFDIDYTHAQKLFSELREYNVIGSAATTPRKIMSREELDELLLTLKSKRIFIASDGDILESWTDEYGVRYSSDGKRLLKASENIEKYCVKDGTIIICDKAFFNTRLFSIIVTEGCELLGSSCFGHCQNLTSITLPSSLREIGSGAFWHCDIINSICIPENVEKIDRHVFASCNNLRSIIVDTKNRHFDSRNNCNAIIDSSNNTLYAACSYSTIPDDVSKIAEFSFNYCEELSSIIIPGTVESIGFQAFSGCKKLKEVVLQEGVREIEHYAFSNVYSLKSIKLPKSLKTIGEGAFEGCNIDTIFIPEGVEQIWDNPFKENNLKNIVVDKNNRYYDSRDNCNAIIQSQSNVLIAGCCSTVIPPSVVMIGESAFEGCRDLTTIVIPEGVKRIAHHAFAHCEGYSCFVNPDEHGLFNEREIEHHEGLTTVFIPNSIERAWGFVFGAPSPKLKIIIPTCTKGKFEKIFLDLYKDKLVEQDKM